MNNQLTYYAQRLATEVWTRSKPTFKLQTATRTLKVAGNAHDGVRLIRHWAPNWKADVVRWSLNNYGKTFVDVGTNIGQSLLDFTHVMKPDERYIGFDPNPNCSEMIRSIINSNNLEFASIIPVGLSDHNGLMQLLIDGNDPTDECATLNSDLRPEKLLEKIWVACFTFDHAIESLKFDDIGLIKIDVEGAELQVLRGMLNTLSARRVPVLCEVLHRDTTASVSSYVERLQGLLDIITKLNYSISLIRRSSDESKVEGLIRLDKFPESVWGPTSPFNCDYLLTPSEMSIHSIT